MASPTGTDTGEGVGVLDRGAAQAPTPETRIADGEAHRLYPFRVDQVLALVTEFYAVCRCGWNSGPLPDGDLQRAALAAGCPVEAAERERERRQRAYGDVLGVRHDA